MSEPTVLIVDDEPPARAKLRRFVEDDGRARVIGEAGDGPEAVAAIESLAQDIVLLDIQMPELDGFGVLAALDVESVPQVIFVTAHDQHALRAFEVRALDYLLKPVDRERFRAALDHALERLDTAPRDAREVLAELPPERRRLDHRVDRLAERVDWIGGAGNYAELHAGGDTWLVRGTLTEIEAGLPPGRFARIHRSAIVNLDRIRELHDWTHGDFMVELNDGTRLRLSRRYRERLDGVFGL